MRTRLVSIVMGAATALACGEHRPSGTTGSALPTPLDQRPDPSDVALVRDARTRLVADDRLSLGAKNVVLVAEAGVVTVRGPFIDVEQRGRLLERIRATPGVTHVEDRLDANAKE
jgi:hypothetical protein